MLRAPDFARRDLSCVETIVVGAAPSPPALVREARERVGDAYSVRYASTASGAGGTGARSSPAESAGVGTGTPFDAPDEEALYTVGPPRPPVELEIRGGEVCLRSPT